MFEPNINLLQNLVAIDPSLIAIMAGAALVITQIIKTTVDDEHIILVNFSVASLIAALFLINHEITSTMLSIIILGYLIASSASGTYSWSKGIKKSEEVIKDER